MQEPHRFPTFLKKTDAISVKVLDNSIVENFYNLDSDARRFDRKHSSLILHLFNSINIINFLCKIADYVYTHKKYFFTPKPEVSCMSFSKKSLLLYSLLSLATISHQAFSHDTKFVKITKNNFITDVLQSKTPVIIKVFAAWCQPCKQMTPILEKLAEEFPNIKFATINVDEERELVAALEISSVPTFIIVHQGKFITGFAGQKSYDDFKKIIMQYLFPKSK